MLLKLYKKEDGKTLYWEAWDDEAENEVVVHFGELGQVGETTAVPLAEFEPPDTAIRRESEVAREAGFAEIEHEDLFELIIRYPLKGEPKESDAELAAQVEEAMNELLGWTGLGHCDGSDLGEGSISVYCYVVDPHVAMPCVVQDLTSNELLDSVVIAYQDKNENFVVLWPENYTGVFE